MAGISGFVGVVALVVLCGLLIIPRVVRLVWSVLAIRRRPPATLPALVIHDYALGTLGRAVAVVGALLAGTIGYQQGLAIAPYAIGGVVAAMFLVAAERSWPLPRGVTRQAELAPRRWIDVAPRRDAAIAGASAVGLGLVVLLVPALAPHPTAAATAIRGPYPGWGDVGVALIPVVVLTGLVWWGIRALTTRSAVAGLPRAVDLALRRAAADRYGRLWAASVLVTAMAICARARETSWQVIDVAGTSSASSGTASIWDAIASGLLVAAAAVVSIARVRPPERMPGHSPTPAPIPLSPTRTGGSPA